MLAVSERELERRRKISQTLSGRSLSDEHRAKLSAAKKGRSLTEECKAKIGLAHRGMKRSAETRKRISEANKGQIQKPEAIAAMKKKLTGRKMSPEQRLHHSSYALRGERHPRWKGGISGENARTRQSVEGRLWREAVFTRDDYTCQSCRQRGGELNAHHLKQFSEFRELRFDLSNGQTLCVPCHRSVHRKDNI